MEYSVLTKLEQKSENSSSTKFSFLNMDQNLLLAHVLTMHLAFTAQKHIIRILLLLVPTSWKSYFWNFEILVLFDHRQFEIYFWIASVRMFNSNVGNELFFTRTLCICCKRQNASEMIYWFVIFIGLIVFPTKCQIL